MNISYSRRSYHFAVFSLILMGIFIVLSITDRMGSTSYDDIVGYLITLLIVSVCIGFIFAVLSLKEKSSKEKVLGMSINILMTIITIGILIYKL